METPILFIHGFGADKKQYQPIIKYLKRKGINKFYEFDYPNKFGIFPIKLAAEELAEYIAENVTEDSVNIIAMSQGGIVALAYMKYYKKKNVEKLFTICTPHKGSKLAKITNLPGFIDLRPGSKLLEELEGFAKDSKINMYSVYTPFDLMVFPGWNAKASYGKTKMIFAPTHPSAFYWPTTLEYIYKNLI